MRFSILLRLGLALVLTAALAGLGATAFQRKVEAFQGLGVTLTAHQGVWMVTEVSEPRVGLQAGDQIFFVNGQPPANLEALRVQLLERPVSQLMVRRGEPMLPVEYQRPPTRIDGAYLVLASIGLIYLLIGFYTVFKDRRGTAFLFHLWCLASAALYILSPSGLGDSLDRIVFLTDRFARIVLPALTVHLFLVFPQPFGSNRWRRWAITALYLPTTVLATFHIDQALAGGRLFGAPDPGVITRVDNLELLFLVAGGLVASLFLWLRYIQRPAWEERRQMAWILLGMVGGYGPFLLLYVVPWVLQWSWPAWTPLVAVVPLALVPLTFAWAILRYKLLDFGSIVRDGLSVALTALLAVFGFSVVNLAIRSGLAQEMSLARNLLTFTSGLVIAGVLAPTRQMIAGGLEQLRHRGTLAQRQRLRDLGQELLFERDLDNLCHRVTETLADALVTRVDLYLAQGGAMVPIAPRADLPRELAFDALGSDLWERDAAAISPVDLAVETSPRQRLFAAGHRYALPLTVRGHRIGVALLAYKFDEEPLSSEDVDLARGLLNQASLAIENAQLLEEVHRKLREVTDLEARNQGILESTPAGIAVLDEHDRVVSANHGFAAVVGRSRREVVSHAMVDLIPVHPLPTPEEGLLEASYCELSGEERHLQLRVATYRRESDGPLRVLIVQDVSEQVAMEHTLKEKERLASLGMLAAGVAHEVNTPLTGISSYAQLLMADIDPSDPHHEILKKMERQTFRAAQIVNNLLEFARNRRDELHPTGLTSLVDESLQLLEERARAADVEIDWQAPDNPMTVLGNDGELHQVVTNLVVNALDAIAGAAAPGDPRRVEVRLERLERRIRLVVSDTGPGIAPERLERIFHPFFSSKVQQGGTGLGLAITYNIVRRHGGEIRATNHADTQGCSFTIELPRADRI